MVRPPTGLPKPRPPYIAQRNAPSHSTIELDLATFEAAYAKAMLEPEDD